MEFHKIYEAEKLSEFRQADLAKLDRTGAYMKLQQDEEKMNAPRSNRLAKIVILLRNLFTLKSHPRR